MTVRSYYRGGHRVMLGGVPCRVSYLPKTEGGKALMRESSRDMCLPLPPRGRKDFAKWEAAQARKYAEAEKLGARSISDVVTIASVEPVQPVEVVPAVSEPIERPARSVEPVEAFSRRLPSRPMTRRPVGAMSGAMRTVNYYRVSTARQGASGLGLEAQRRAVEAFCDGRGCDTLAEYVEIESGKRDDRPELAKALHHAKVTGATVVIAKLDRLSRNVAFLAQLQDAGVKFLCADMPEANEMVVGMMAVIAQHERKVTSVRTKAALQEASRRAKEAGQGFKADGTPWKTGDRLGNPMGVAALGDKAAQGRIEGVAVIKSKARAFALDIMPIVEAIRADGHTSLLAIADQLNERGIMTPRNGRWHAKSVSRLIEQAGAS